MAGYRNVSYDNTEIDFLKYVGSWTIDGSYTATNVDETGTLSLTKDQTANITFIFPELANAFYYYGIGRCCGGLYAICIDCDFDSPAGSFEPIDGVNRSDDGKNPPVLLYSKAFDAPGLHKIILTNQPDMRFTGGNSQLTVDRFVIQVDDDSASASVSSATSSKPMSSISITSSIAPEASQSSRTSSTSSKPPIGATVGGVLGGITAILLCFIVWWVFMRRRQHNIHPQDTNMNTSLYTSLYQLSPFIVARSNTHTPTADVTSDRSSRETDSTTGVKAGEGLSSRRTHSSSSRMATGSDEPVPRREIDAGRIDVGDDDDLRTLPPEYDDIFHGRRSVAREQNHRSLLFPNRPGPPNRLEGPPSEVLGQPSLQPTKF